MHVPLHFLRWFTFFLHTANWSATVSVTSLLCYYKYQYEMMGWRQKQDKIWDGDRSAGCSKLNKMTICINKQSLTLPIFFFFWSINMYNTDNTIKVNFQSQSKSHNSLHLDKIHPAVSLNADLQTALPLFLTICSQSALLTLIASSFAGVQSTKDVLDFKQPCRAQEEVQPVREDAAVRIRHTSLLFPEQVLVILWRLFGFYWQWTFTQ